VKRFFIFLFLFFFCWSSFQLSALVLKNDTDQAIKILSFSDARGWKFCNVPYELKPKQMIEVQNVSYQADQQKPACLEHLTLVTQTDIKKQAFILNLSAKELGRIYNGVTGLTFGIPKKRKELRKYYELQEKFPGQLNIRTQNISSMQRC